MQTQFNVPLKCFDYWFGHVDYYANDRHALIRINEKNSPQNTCPHTSDAGDPLNAASYDFPMRLVEDIVSPTDLTDRCRNFRLGKLH